MRFRLQAERCAGFWLVMASIVSGPALAQGSAPVSDPTECPKEVAAIATCYSAKHPSGAYLLAAIPNSWNGHLVVFAHGGPAVVPPTANTSKSDLAKYSIAVERGFGWVASSYRREGYGVQMAVEDTEHARQFFVERIRQPLRTVLHGASYGGLVGAKLIEQQGAVSQEVAEAMADGALDRFDADLGVAITGIAGPDGGSEEKPVGYVCFNARLADGTTIARDPVIPGDRHDIRERSALVGMHLLRNLLGGDDEAAPVDAETASDTDQRT